MKKGTTYIHWSLALQFAVMSFIAGLAIGVFIL